MKIIMTIILFPILIIGNSTVEIPSEYNRSVKLYGPKNDLITLKDSVNISGRVADDIKIYIENSEIKPSIEGKFDHEISLDKLGQQDIHVSFRGLDFEFSIKRRLIKLKNPENTIMTQRELAFVNTEYASESIRNLSLNNTFKKYELAFFLRKISLVDEKSNIKIENLSSIDRYKNDIQSVVNSKILSVDEKNNFNANEEVKIIHLLAGISRALNFKISKSDANTSAKNKQWFDDYVEMAIQNNILLPSEVKSIHKKLTHAGFIKIASRLPDIQSSIDRQLVFNSNNEIEKTYPSKEVVLDYPTDVIITNIKLLSKTTKEISGNVSPVKPFTLNWRKINPDSKGNFSVIIPRSQNRLQINFGNELVVKDLPQNESKVARLKITKKPVPVTSSVPSRPTIMPYKDLTKHWISDIANQLKLEGKLENTTNFNPNQEITRSDLAKYIVNINNLQPSKASNNPRFSDLNASNPNYEHIQTVISNKLLNGVSATKFSPNSKVTKIQAIIVAARLLPDSADYESVELPYSDVQNFKWANQSLKKAYYYKIISKATNLNPKKTVSNAELVSILYKVSKI